MQMRTRSLAATFGIIAIPMVYAVLCLGQNSGSPAEIAFGHSVLVIRDSETGYAVNALVKVQGRGGSVTLKADAAGRVTLQLPTGEYGVAISAAGYKPMRLDLDLAPVANQNGTIHLDPERTPEEERPEAIQAHLRKGYTVLHGFVVDEVGKALGGVTVRLGSGEAKTDVRGHYFVSVETPSLTRTGPGALTLSFEKPGYRTLVIENFKVTSDELAEVPMGMTTGHGEIRHVAREPGGSTGPMDARC